MANENKKINQAGQTRRSFLAKMGIGVAALAIVGGPLGNVSRIRGENRSADSREFPDETSIFHPAADPRQDPRRSL